MIRGPRKLKIVLIPICCLIGLFTLANSLKYGEWTNDIPFASNILKASSGFLAISIPKADKKSVLPQALVIDELVCLMTFTPQAFATQ